jgi:phage gp36-like protein
MAYCTQADIQIRYPAAQITDLLDDEGDGSLVTTRLTQIIVEVDALIDTFLRVQHTVPYTGGDETVKNISIDLSYVSCMRRRRGAKDDDGINTIEKNAMEKLKLIAKGTIKLAGSSSFQNTQGYLKSNKDSTDKLYTSDRLKRFTNWP